MFEIQYLPPAERYLKKLKDKNLKKQYLEAIKAIRMDPSIGNAKTGDLVGIWSYDIYYKKTNYELAYRVVSDKNGNIVVIIMAGTRENFYEELKRYMK